MGALRVLEALRMTDGTAREYQDSRSQICDATKPTAGRADGPAPAVAVQRVDGFPHWMTRNYRESYGLWAVSGILFNS